MKYSEKLKDPRWQKKRLRILERDEWACQQCLDGENTLVVHHLYYEPNREPWDYPDEGLITLCEGCHEEEREAMARAEAALLTAIRKCFLAREIAEIATGFEKLALLYPPNGSSYYTAEAIALALGDREAMRSIWENWRRAINEFHQQRQNECEREAGKIQ